MLFVIRLSELRLPSSKRRRSRSSTSMFAGKLFRVWHSIRSAQENSERIPVVETREDLSSLGNETSYDQLGYNQLGYNQLGYSQLGYNQLVYNLLLVKMYK